MDLSDICASLPQNTQVSCYFIVTQWWLCFVVIESKPDNPSEDLRFYSPFPELQKFADAVTFEGIDSAKHAHIPFAVILIRLLDQWRKEHDGKAPETRADKDAFKKKILEMANHPDVRLYLCSKAKGFIYIYLGRELPWGPQVCFEGRDTLKNTWWRSTNSTRWEGR